MGFPFQTTEHAISEPGWWQKTCVSHRLLLNWRALEAPPNLVQIVKTALFRPRAVFCFFFRCEMEKEKRFVAPSGRNEAGGSLFKFVSRERVDNVGRLARLHNERARKKDRSSENRIRNLSLAKSKPSFNFSASPLPADGKGRGAESTHLSTRCHPNRGHAPFEWVPFRESGGQIPPISLAETRTANPGAQSAQRRRRIVAVWSAIVRNEPLGDAYRAFPAVSRNFSARRSDLPYRNWLAAGCSKCGRNVRPRNVRTSGNCVRIKRDAGVAYRFAVLRDVANGQSAVY